MKAISTPNINNVTSNFQILTLLTRREYIYEENSDLIEFGRVYLYFMLYSFVGWIWEEIFMLVVDGTVQEKRVFTYSSLHYLWIWNIFNIIFILQKKL